MDVESNPGLHNENNSGIEWNSKTICTVKHIKYTRKDLIDLRSRASNQSYA